MSSLPDHESGKYVQEYFKLNLLTSLEKVQQRS